MGLSAVMPGFMPLYAGHPRLYYCKMEDVDGRDKPGRARLWRID